jgi:hypothetical protein
VKRPSKLAWVLSLCILGMAVFNLLGLLGGLRDYSFLRTLPLRMPPAYLVASRAFWGAAFLTLAVGICAGRKWARFGVLAAFSLYLAQRWGDRLLLARSDYALLGLPVDLAVDLLALALLWGILLSRRARPTFAY